MRFTQFARACLTLPSTPAPGGLASQRVFIGIVAWLLAPVLMVASSPRAMAQDGADDPTFNTMDDGTYGAGATGPVRPIVLQPDGKALVAGIQSYNGVQRWGIARLTTDGRLDTSFDPGVGTDHGSSYDLALRTDGKVMLVGLFSSFGGFTRNCIVRINPDGSVDTSFAPGSGPNTNEINTVAVQPDGKSVVGGNFTSFSGVSRSRIARLNANGSLDTTFNPGTGASSGSVVYRVVVQPDGKVLVGGSFTSFNGIARAGIVRLNSDGSVDTTFDPGTGTVGPATIVVQPDGKVLIGGSFTSYNGVARNRLARIHADGSLDTSFNPGSGANNAVESISLRSDGKLMIAGLFTTYNGVARTSVARVNADGSLDTSFATLPGPDHWARAVAVRADGRAVIGGHFQRYDGHVRKFVTQVNGDGSLDTSFNPYPGADATVWNIVPLADGRTWISGFFDTFDDVVCRRLARLIPDGSFDASFVPGTGPNDSVFPIAPQPDGGALIGGAFTSYGAVTRNRIARILPGGGLDASFNPGTGASSFVYAIALQPDGKALIGGAFTSYNGVARNGIARVNADGSLDTSFNPGTGANNGVNRIVLQPDGKALIAGGFTTYNGVARNRIARVNADGSLDTTFDPGTGANNQIAAIVLMPDGKALIGGYFSSYNGVARNSVARVNASGSLDTAFNPGTGANNPVKAITLQLDGKLLIAGTFSTFDGVARLGIARLTTTGSLDAAFESGVEFDSEVVCISSLPDGKALIGGDFTIYDGVPRNRLTRVLGTAPLQAGPIADNTVCVGGSVSVPYTASFTYGAGNVFSAQLSDATGSFAAPVVIGALASTTSGSISATVPGGTPVGSAYRIRVVSSDPAVAGLDNGSDLAAALNTTWYEDADGDGSGDPASSVFICLQPPGYVANALDGCPSDPAKVAPGICGCGVSDADSDGDGTVDCLDGCPSDPNKVVPGACGCGVSDADSDGDGTLDCNDGCPNDPTKITPGLCGCNAVDDPSDGDGDGTADCIDGCPSDPTKISPGQCGCGFADIDSDGDGTANCIDGCPSDPGKISPGQCGCGFADTDTDGDGTANCIDGCPIDPDKTAPGLCGCGVADTDSDFDSTPDCTDGCPNDPNKTAPGLCGCGLADTDSDFDGIPDCDDPLETLCHPGVGGVLPCPCGQPPNPSGGCANFGAGSTTGAVLSGSGLASLAADTLLLTTSNHRSPAQGVLNVFFSYKPGSATPTTGIPSGAGVRCIGTGGSLKRLYTVQIFGGAGSKPGMGDLSVSAQSATFSGHAIVAPETRFYFNVYRDGQASGPCGSTAISTNLTNMGSVLWGP